MSPEPLQLSLPACTVVVCTRDRPVELDRCLHALTRLSYPHYDILVVDNAPIDNRAREVAARYGTGYLLESVPGLSRARNAGGRAAQGQIVAFIDDDAMPEPDWLSELIPAFADPNVMAVAGRVEPVDAQNRSLRPSNSSQERCSFDRETPGWFERANFGGIGHGANFAVRHSAFKLWPGFDERLGKGVLIEGNDEHHAFFSLIHRGYRVAYSPNATVRHPTPAGEEAFRARQFKDLAASAGYITLLFFEEPLYRRAVLKFALDALRGRPRPWRLPSPHGPHYRLDRWRVWLAYLVGPWLYLRSRFRR